MTLSSLPPYLSAAAGVVVHKAAVHRVRFAACQTCDLVETLQYGQHIHHAMWVLGIPLEENKIDFELLFLYNNHSFSSKILCSILSEIISLSAVMDVAASGCQTGRGMKKNVTDQAG